MLLAVSRRSLRSATRSYPASSLARRFTSAPSAEGGETSEAEKNQSTAIAPNASVNRDKPRLRPALIRRREAKANRIKSMLKTELCKTFSETGKCDIPNCGFAHGASELRPAPYFERAAEIAKERGSRNISASDMLQAQLEKSVKSQGGLLAIIDGLGIKTEVVSEVEWSMEALSYVQKVQKASITIPFSRFTQAWCFTSEQATMLKKVVGPRYDIESDTFKLTRRNQAPFTEIHKESTVHDSLIRKLVQLSLEVKRVVVPFYSFEDEDNNVYRAFPRIPVIPNGE